MYVVNDSDYYPQYDIFFFFFFFFFFEEEEEEEEEMQKYQFLRFKNMKIKCVSVISTVKRLDWTQQNLAHRL